MKKQSWVVGQKVKVGFLSGLEVTAKERRSGETVYTLRSPKGKLYEFTPYYGIRAI